MTESSVIDPTVKISTKSVVAELWVQKTKPTDEEVELVNIYCNRLDVPMNEIWDGVMYLNIVVFYDTHSQRMTRRMRRSMFPSDERTLMLELIKSELQECDPSNRMYMESLAELWLNVRHSK